MKNKCSYGIPSFLKCAIPTKNKIKKIRFNPYKYNKASDNDLI